MSDYLQKTMICDKSFERKPVLNFFNEEVKPFSTMKS
jgi:hypothetical protein